jgi:ADP-dependent NAD(P)H-hydrate dehydratase / NAD(P)H-hydrate epimerase
MQKVLTAEEMREVDRLTTEKYGIPSILLMENAAHAAARIITEKLGGSVAGKSFLILCGKGNNGGDGAALARILWAQNAKVKVFLFGKIEETKGDAKVNFEIIKSFKRDFRFHFEEVELTEEKARKWWTDFIYNFAVTETNCIIDALFGTGLTRPIERPLATIIETLWSNIVRRLNSLALVSLDIPSGLNSDLSETNGFYFYPDITVTFTAPKPANVLSPSSRYNGELFVANIGSPPELIEDSPSQLFLAEKSDAQYWLAQTSFTPDSHKTKRGRALIVAGSRKMAGAAVLAANAAMMSGVGLLRVVTAESALDAVATRTVAEAMVAGVAETEDGAISHDALAEVLELTKKADVVAVGSGLSSDEETTRKFVRSLIEKRKFPVLIDADGLNALAPFDLIGSDEFPLILTPHIGEMRKLLGVDDKEDFSDRVSLVRDFAQKHHVILVLKGERNLIAAPDGRVVVNPTGNSGLGKAGNGDTLAGIITAFLAQSIGSLGDKADFFAAVVAAVYIAGMAGDAAAEKYGKRAMKASHVVEFLPEVFQKLEND